MTVIAISSPGFSAERELARRLAERLGFRCVDPEVVLERAAAWGRSQDELLDALLTPPALFGRATDRKQRCLALLQAALAEELRTGDAVCYGNLAEMAPKGAADVVRVKLGTPLRVRCGFVQDCLRFTRAEALAYLQKLDWDRMRWLRHVRHSGLATTEPHDVTIELNEIGLHQAVPRVAAAIEARPRAAIAACDELTAWAVPAVTDLNAQPDARPGLGRTWATLGLVLAGVLAFSAVLVRFADSLSSRLLPAGGGETQTIVGVITDTLCGSHHNFSGAANEVECIEACVRRGGGAGYALYDGTQLYRLDDPGAARKYAAQEVVVTGTLNRAAKTLHVASIAPHS